MLFNIDDLKDGVSISDVELVLGEMCNVVKNNYGDDNGGLIGGQVYKNAGFVSTEGSIGETADADKLFKQYFSKLEAFCDGTFEVGYEMLWQGVPEDL
jgi:hypothetical protein